MAKHQPLTAAEIEAGEKLCEGATPGPWDAGRCSVGYVDGLWEWFSGDNPRRDISADAALIASARTLLPRALADLKELRSKLSVRYEGSPIEDGIQRGIERQARKYAEESDLEPGEGAKYARALAAALLRAADANESKETP